MQWQEITHEICEEFVCKLSFFFTLGWGGGAGYFGFGWLLFCVGVVFGCFRVGFFGGFLVFFHLLCSHNFKVAIMTAIFFHNLILLKQIQLMPKSYTGHPCNCPNFTGENRMRRWNNCPYGTLEGQDNIYTDL